MESACTTLAHPGACTALEPAAWIPLDVLWRAPWSTLWTCQRGRVRGLSAGLAWGLVCTGKPAGPTQGLAAAGLAPPVPGTQCRHPGRCMPGSLVWPAPAGSPHAAQLPVEEDRSARHRQPASPHHSKCPRVGSRSLYGRSATTSIFASSVFRTTWA